MHAIELLLLQTEQAHAAIRGMLAGVEAEHADWRPGEGRPSLSDLCAHWLEEVESTGEALTGQARGGPVPSAWAQARTRLNDAMARSLAGLRRLDESALEMAPLVAIHPGFEELLATRQNWWRGHVFHLVYHLGQAASLRAAQGLPREI
ncbi:MAG: DinB family protein [Planctomycetota bacterium]|nr:DinB family protein [Planctomycetota bacterium]